MVTNILWFRPDLRLADQAIVTKATVAAQPVLPCFIIDPWFYTWQQQGLILFFLPPYSPQMNRIEEEWLHLKRDELASRVFEDEVDLAYAIMEGLENRGKNGGYAVKRFKFN